MNRPESGRVTVKRGANRAVYEQADMLAVLDMGHVAHMGCMTDDGPIVLPMAYGRTDSEILLHGSVANAMLRAGGEADVCVTVTIVDGLVVARSAFHNSMNYRSVVIRGLARLITDSEEKIEALRIITDHVADNWDTRREATEKELKATMVIGVPLTEMSGKIRGGGPIDDDADLGGPQWAGVIPLTSVWGTPVPADDIQPGCDMPATLSVLVEG
jgi:nitroimidazol reductase NimA-like FMN-containing flavoprotein (pyridoxamine 5'-phosphate oxidase superfamily)